MLHFFTFWTNKNTKNAIKEITTLTFHFISYTLVVPSWTSFAFRTALILLWHSFKKVLETFL